MPSLFEKSVSLWGDELPPQISELPDKSDESVYAELDKILSDLLAPNWVKDAQIAWKIMTGRV